MSDHLERVEAFLDLREKYEQTPGIRLDSPIGVVATLWDDDRNNLDTADLRALLADAKQLRAQGTEYGIDATFASTRSATFTVADTLGDALKALEEFDAKRGDVVCRQLVERPVGEWRKVGDAR